MVFEGIRVLALYHGTTQPSRSPLPRVFKHNTIRRHFSIVSAYFARRSEIDTSLCKLRTIVSRYNTPSHPSIMVHGNRRTRFYPVCKVQHRTAPFQHRFEVFCKNAKNRHIAKLNSSNRGSSIWLPLRDFRRSMWLPLRVFERLARSLACFSTVSSYFVGSTKIDTSQTKIQTTASCPCGAPTGCL